MNCHKSGIFMADPIVFCTDDIHGGNEKYEQGKDQP